MAEILLSLTIIGVVAAITLPSLTGNINERTWNTQRKALYARFSQALPLMDALNGYGTLKEESSSKQQDAGKLCLAQDTESRVPNREELSSIFYNRVMFNIAPSGYVWTSSVIDSSRGWTQSFFTGRAMKSDRNGEYEVWCVKR